MTDNLPDPQPDRGRRPGYRLPDPLVLLTTRTWLPRSQFDEPPSFSCMSGERPAFVAPTQLLLNRSIVSALLTMADCIPAVESALPPMRRAGRSATRADARRCRWRDWLRRRATRLGERAYTAIKANGGFFQNRARSVVPNIQGIVVLANGRNGCRSR